MDGMTPQDKIMVGVGVVITLAIIIASLMLL